MTTTEGSRQAGVAVGAMLLRTIHPRELLDYAAAVAPGLDELWIVEDLPFAGGISQLAALLEATGSSPEGTRPGGPIIGHGIAPAPFRNPAVLAMEWATLASMYPGRLAAGIGHGVPAWMEQIGERVGSPLTLLEETIDGVQQLLAGERLSVRGRYVRIDGVQLVFPPTVPPRVSAGVMGPKSLALAGRVAGGTILPEGQGPAEIEAARAEIDTGRRLVGRTDHHRLTVFTGFYCGDPAGLGPPPPDAPSGWAAIAETPDEVVDMLRGLVDAGADSIVLVPFGTDGVAQLRLAAAEIAPALR